MKRAEVMTAANSSTMKDLIDDLQGRIERSKLGQTVEDLQFHIKALRLAHKTAEEWAETEEADVALSIEHRKESVRAMQWERSDERWTMLIASDLAPIYHEDSSDNIAKRAVQIVAAVRARFVQGES